MISAAALSWHAPVLPTEAVDAILVHEGGVLSGRAPCVPEPEWENRHTLDGLAVPNRQFCRAFWRQVGSHVSLLWRSQQSFLRAEQPSLRPAGYTHPSRVRSIWVMVAHQFPELVHQP